jgi:hypothetical protein
MYFVWWVRLGTVSYIPPPPISRVALPPRLPDGSVKLPDGRLRRPNGTFASANADGSYNLLDGTKLLADGGILLPTGAVRLPDGSTLLPDGTIRVCPALQYQGCPHQPTNQPHIHIQ